MVESKPKTRAKIHRNPKLAKLKRKVKAALKKEKHEEQMLHASLEKVEALLAIKGW